MLPSGEPSSSMFRSALARRREWLPGAIAAIALFAISELCQLAHHRRWWFPGYYEQLSLVAFSTLLGGVCAAAWCGRRGSVPEQYWPLLGRMQSDGRFGCAR